MAEEKARRDATELMDRWRSQYPTDHDCKDLQLDAFQAISMARLVVVVTGANSGIGFGICHRLLLQLSRRHPSDAAPFYCTSFYKKENNRKNTAGGIGEPQGGCEENQLSAPSLTVVMACRSIKRADLARRKLLLLLDADIEKRKEKEPGHDDAYAKEFRKNIQIDIISLDLSDMQSIFRFGDKLREKYSYVSHLVCNAGLASFTSIDPWGFVKELFSDPVNALTSPDYYGQTKGELSVNGLGWIWQCNVFGHYALFRTIEPLLTASPSSSSSLGPRVIWMSSLQALARYLDKDDWQLVKSDHAYEASKYQLELIATQIERVSLAAHKPEDPARIRHFIVDPGVTNTKFSAKLRNFFTTIIQLALFYLVRFFGSLHHTITPYKAAVSAVQLCIVPLYFVNAYKLLEGERPERQTSLKVSMQDEPDFRVRRFYSITDRAGQEGVRVGGISKWDENQMFGVALLGRFEELYQYWKEEVSKDKAT